MISKRLLFNIYKELVKFNIKQRNNLIKKWAKESNTHFSKEEMNRWPIGTWKKYSISLVIREMQMKTIMKYHLTPVRIVIITKNTNNKCWQGYGRKETFIQCWQECKLLWPLWRKYGGFSENLRTTYDPVIPFLSIYWKKNPTNH